MGRIQCRICNSEDSIRDVIESLLLKKRSYRDIANQYLKNFGCDLHSLEQSIAKHHKSHLNNEKHNVLTDEDSELLKRFSEGSVDFNEASRIIATNAFERILRNPSSVQVRDWLQSELIKLKKQELDDKNTWAMELVNRMFSGHLPPKNCINCGHPFIEEVKQKELERDLDLEIG